MITTTPGTVAMPPTIIRAALALLIGLLGPLSAADAPATPDAATILAVVGRPVGMAHLPRCHDGALAIALAKAMPTAYVHGQDADGSAVRRARVAADEAGPVSLRVGFDEAGLARLLPVARSCDLVVLTDLAHAELTPALATEITRVLAPWYGVAVLGGKGIAEQELKAWAAAIGQLTTDARLPGMVIARAAPLEGADDWTHWWHTPDNNPVSNDHAYTLPETVQWMGKPFYSSNLDEGIVAGGRCFVLGNGDRRAGDNSSYLADGEFHGRPLLMAMSAGSGARLWTREMPDVTWEAGARGILVAHGDRLLVAEGDRVLALDQASGAELARVDATCGQIRWLAASGDRLLVLGGPSVPLGDLNAVRASMPTPFRASGLALAAFAVKDLSPAWRADRSDGPDAFDPTSPAIADGRVIITTVGGTIESRELSDGRVAWSTPGLVKRRTKQAAYEWDTLSRHPVSGFAVAGLYLSECVGLEGLTALDLHDGSRRWQMATETYWGNGGGVLFFDEHIFVSAFRLTPAGAFVDQSGANRSGCARLTASPIGLFGNNGFCWDVTTKKPAGGAIPAKSSCSTGTFVADGLAWKFPVACVSCTEWRGYLVRGPREAAAEPLPRLTTIVAKPPKPAGETPPGWTTYRGDARRSGGSPATIPAGGAAAWTVKALRERATLPSWGRLIDPEQCAAPPVVAGETIVIGDADGSLTALALGDGHRLWRAAVGSRIWSSPTIWRDRVLVGCADGTLAAFTLADGTELWRLRVASASARMPFYGQLGSRWPVVGSPLVVGDRGFAVAGLLGGVDGVTMVGFDPATGTLLWERSDWSEAGIGGLISGAGQLCWDGQSVIYHGGDSPLARLDPATGTLLPPYKDQAQVLGGVAWAAHVMKGQDVGALPDGTLVLGGRRLLSDLNEDSAMRTCTTFLLRDEASQGLLPMIAQAEGTRTYTLPSWDDRDAVSFERAGNERLSLAAIADVHAALAATIVGPKVDMPNGPVRPITGLKVRWAHDIRAVRALALAANAVVALESPDWEHWRVAAYARADGASLWSVRLPEGPTNSGLAIAADGRVVVTLCDGSVLAIAASAAQAH
jgi:outer membrane protein assembly factor BamB